MNTDNIHAYSAPLWQRFTAPRHAGELSGAGVYRAEAGSVAARSLLRLDIRVEAARIVEARFKAYGCPSAIAVGEWLCEQIEGQGIDILRSPGCAAPAIREALEIAEDRAHCALMGEDALRALSKPLKMTP